MKEAKAEIEIHSVIGKKSESVQYNLEPYKSFCKNQSILLYFFKKIISCFIFTFQSKFLTYVFLNQTFKIVIYFQLNQKFSMFQLVPLLQIIFHLHSCNYCE